MTSGVRSSWEIQDLRNAHAKCCEAQAVGDLETELHWLNVLKRLRPRKARSGASHVSDLTLLIDVGVKNTTTSQSDKVIKTKFNTLSESQRADSREREVQNGRSQRATRVSTRWTLPNSEFSVYTIATRAGMDDGAGQRSPQISAATARPAPREATNCGRCLACG